MKGTKIIAITITFLFLGTMFFNLFYMSMGMDMSSGMNNCPFMSHGEVICQMNLADHIGAWKSVFLSAAPALTLLLAIAGAAVLVVSVAPNLLRIIHYAQPPLNSCLRLRTYTFSYRLLQELFSSGILHPKLF